MYVKTGFDGPTAAALPYRTRSAANAGEPVWEESLPEMYYTAGGRAHGCRPLTPGRG